MTFRARQRAAAVGAAALLALLTACSSTVAVGTPARTQRPGSTPAGPPRSPSDSPSPTSSPTPSPTPAPQQLPGGGRTIFPGHLVVAHYGSVGGPALGLLGRGSAEQAAQATVQDADRYRAASKDPVLPAMDFITTVADAPPGKDGDYSAEVKLEDVQRYLDAARAHKMLLILDFQPGLADFLDQIKQYESILLQPEVGVALDPEWVLQPGQRHLKQVGHTDAATINRVSAYLSQLVKDHNLPDKMLVLHQFQLQMIRDRASVIDRPGLATVIQADGHGPRMLKLNVYHALAAGAPFPMGIKLFPNPPKKDTNLLSPKEALAITPRPTFISYQ